MPTQRAKFELFTRLQELGFSYDEAVQLRRIEMTLHRWSEAECNGEIEREGEDQWARPQRNSKAWINGTALKRHSWPVADRERGAIQRLEVILKRHPALLYYHQSDPRGCALYIVNKPGLVEGGPNELRRWLSENYNRGVAVCA